MKQYLLNERETRSKAIPELETNLGIITRLRDAAAAGESSVPFLYQLGDLLYAKARITDVSRLNLWLGADIMVEYSLDEAEGLLRKNLEDVRAAIQGVEGNLHFLQEQMETAQCNLTRVQNWAALHPAPEPALKE
eukprot:gnl/Chilomastix_cuspidata/920.p3 GENE.gnl/Chilomastix_cuspidata/920~~gnl/Chilomastix_cuspidata/920.p3  ORF type:complete len:135 (+),score=69.80 gnl/Chilomastix_cuspidata/920:200-604(+)